MERAESVHHYRSPTLRTAACRILDVLLAGIVRARLAEREQKQREGLWLNDKNPVIGLSKLNPLPRRFSGKQELDKPKPLP